MPPAWKLHTLSKRVAQKELSSKEVYEAQEVSKTTTESQKTPQLGTSSQKHTLRRKHGTLYL